jgi:osmoprotectant transport system permease protein
VAQWLQTEHGVVMLGARLRERVRARHADRAAALSVRTIADLPLMPQLRMGSDFESSCARGVALRDGYGLAFSSERQFQPTFMYQALTSGNDVISAFSSDGRIVANDLVASRIRQLVPPYDAVILLSPRRAHDPVLVRRCSRWSGAFPST